MKNNQRFELGTRNAERGNGTWRSTIDLVFAVIAFATIAFLVLLGLNAASGADISAGYTFSSGEQNITHTKLNSVLSGATINTTFFTDKSASTAPASTDTLLLFDGSAFKKITVGNLTLNNLDLISTRNEDTAPATNDFFLTYDASATGYKKVSLYTLQATVSTNTAVVAAARNMVITNSSASAVVITAGEFIAKDSNGIPALLRNVSVTVTMGAAGVNSLDTGAEAASTWYYVWIIASNANAQVAGLFSVSATDPALPSGYTYRGLAGAVYNNASSAFGDFFQMGKAVSIDLSQFVTNTAIVSSNSLQEISAGQRTSFQTAVAPIAVAYSGVARRTDTIASGGGAAAIKTSYLRLSPIGADSQKAVGQWLGSFATNAPGVSTYNSWRVPSFYTGSSRSFFFSTDNVDSTWSFYVTGFELP